MTYYESNNGFVREFDRKPYGDNWTKLSAKEGKAKQKASAIADLREIIHPGQDVYTKVGTVSRSGMSRTISVYVVEDLEVRDITPLVAKACEYSMNKRLELKIKGCGMDMCFEVVYRLGHALWPNGTDKPHSTRNGEPDTDGGYALNKCDL